ncbi:MAG: hypothetical protein JOZ29_04035 [Deltaproteobacteria bacterium]|nr:hypothetical protein [Deltaproteobacteria bacterium]
MPPADDKQEPLSPKPEHRRNLANLVTCLVLIQHYNLFAAPHASAEDLLRGKAGADLARQKNEEIKLSLDSTIHRVDKDA